MTDEQVIQGFLNNGKCDKFRGDLNNIESENLRTTHDRMFLRTTKNNKVIAEWRYWDTDECLYWAGDGWDVMINQESPEQYIKLIEYWTEKYDIPCYCQ